RPLPPPSTACCPGPRSSAADPPDGPERSPGVGFGGRLAGPRKDRVQLAEQLGVELDLQRAQAAVELRARARSDDRAGDHRVRQQPGERHVGRLLAELATEALEGFELGAMARLLFLRPLAVAAAALAGAMPRPRQRTAGERAIGDDAHAVGGAGGQHLELEGPFDQAVLALLGHDTEEAPARRRLVRPRDVPAGEVGRADVDDLPLLDQELHRLPDLVPGRLAIHVVHLVEVQMIGREPPQAPFAGGADVARRQPALVRPVAHLAVDLRREHDLLAPAAPLRQPPPDDLLRHALALLPAVDVGGVEEVDPQLERAIHDRERLPLAGLGPEVHRPEAEPTDLQRRPTEPDVVHAPNLAASIGRGNGALGRGNVRGPSAVFSEGDGAMRRNRSKPGLFWRAVEWSAVLVGLTWFVTWGLAQEQRQRWSRLRHRP